MKITFLGTGTSSGIPLLTCKCNICNSTDIKDKRLRSSVFIEYKNKNILIDIGPDFRQQMLRENIQKIDSILITHTHNDHIAGLDEIRAYNFSSKKTMNVYVDDISEMEIKNHFDYMFRDNKYEGIADVKLINTNKSKFKIEDIEIIPIEIYHHKLPMSAYRINDFAYVTDIKTISKKEFEKLKGVKTLVISALRYEEHFAHFTFKEALKFVENLQVEKAYFTHISHKFDLHKNIVKQLPKNVFIAYDGLKIIV